MKQFPLKFLIELGQTSQENTDIIKRSKQNDIWLHLASGSGPHAVIHNAGKSVDRSTLYQAAQQIKDHSRFKKLRNVPIEYTEIHNVSCGNKPGEIFLKKAPEILRI